MLEVQALQPAHARLVLSAPAPHDAMPETGKGAAEAGLARRSAEPDDDAADNTLEIKMALELVDRVEVVDKVEVALTCLVDGSGDPGARPAGGDADENRDVLPEVPKITAGNNMPSVGAGLFKDMAQTDTALLVVLEQLDASLQREAQSLQRAEQLETQLRQARAALDNQALAAAAELSQIAELSQSSRTLQGVPEGGTPPGDRRGVEVQVQIPVLLSDASTAEQGAKDGRVPEQASMRDPGQSSVPSPQEEQLREAERPAAAIEEELARPTGEQRAACRLVLAIQQELGDLREVVAREIDASEVAEREADAVKRALVATADELDALKAQSIAPSALEASRSLVNQIQQALLAVSESVKAEMQAAEDEAAEVDSVKMALVATADELEALKQDKGKTDDANAKALETLRTQLNVMRDYSAQLTQAVDVLKARHSALEIKYDALKINEVMLEQQLEATEYELKGLQTSCAALEQRSALEKAAAGDLAALRELLATREEELRTAKKQAVVADREMLATAQRLQVCVPQPYGCSCWNVSSWC